MKNRNKWTSVVTKSIVAGILSPILLTSSLPVSATENAPEIAANAAMSVDFGTGKVLLAQNADETLGIASMTKMLVEYILFESIENGTLSWNQELTVSDYAQKLSQNYILSNVPLRAGETYTVLEMYEALAIYSANGATVVLAEAIAGSEPAFVDLMKEKVASWGIEDAHLVNTTGLNNSYLDGNLYPGSSETDENTMTAREILMVASKLIEDYPEVLETSSIPEKIFREGTSDAILMKNWNWMLPGLIYERKFVDGLKTGTTEFAGASITATAKEGDRRVISVVMNAGDGQVNKSQRFEESGKLLDYSFSNWHPLEVIQKDEAISKVDPLPVSQGKEETIQLKASETAVFLAPKGTEVEEYLYEFVPHKELIDEEGSFVAPIEEGTELGVLVFDNTQESLGYLDHSMEESIPVVAASTVEKASVFSLAMAQISQFFSKLVSRFKK